MVKRPIRRGDIFWVNLPRFKNHRWVVIQNDAANHQLEETILVPIVTQKRKKIRDWEVKVPEGICPEPSVINCSAIVTWSISELGDYVGSLDTDTLQRVDAALCTQLDIWRHDQIS